MSAIQRLDRANQLVERLTHIRHHQAKAQAALALVDEQVNALAFEIVREQVAAQAAILDEQAHHMDPHPTPLSVLRGGR